MSNSTKSPSPTKISPKKTAQEFQAASEAVELEYNAVKRLKRLSIGNSLNFDPDLPPTDPYLLDQQQKSISSSLDVNRSKSIHSVSSLNKSFNNYQYNDDDQNSGYEYSTASLNDSYTNESDIGNHSISLSNKSIGEGLINFNDDDDDDDDLDDNVDFLDLDPDSSFNDSDIMWVPANAHPKLSPQNFRKHIQETVDGINTKLKRSGSIKSSLNYDSTDASDSSTADVNSNIRKPSLKELTLQLESLSKKAGLDNNDPVTLARSLSTRSIGITKIERDYSTDNSDDSGTEGNIYRAKSRKLLLNKNTSRTRESLFIKDVDDFTNLDGEDKNEDEEAYIEMNKSTSSINSNPPDFVSNLKRGRWTNYRRQQSAKQNDAVDSTDKPSLPALPNQSNSVSANFNRTHVYKDIQKVYNAQKPLGRPQLEPIKLRTPSSKLPDVPSQTSSTATENALLSDYPKRSKESLPQRPQQQQQQQHYQNNHGRQPVAQNQQYTHIQKQQQLQSAQHQIPHRHHRRAHPNQHLNQQQFQNQQYQQDLNSRHRMPQNNGYTYNHHHQQQQQRQQNQQQQQQQQQQLQITHRDRDRDRDSDRQQHSQQMDPNPRPLQIAPQTTQKQPRQQPQPQSHRSQAASSAAFVSQNAAVGHPSASSLTSPTTKEFFDNNKNLRSSPASTPSLAPNKSNKPVISQAQPTLPKQKPVSSSPILSAAFSASKAVSTPSSPRLTSTDSEVTKVSSEIDQLDLNKTAVKVPAVKVSSGPLEVEKNREKDSEKSTSKGKSFTSFFKIKRDKSSQRSASLALDEPKKLKVKRSLSHSSESSGLSSPKSDFKSFFSKKDKDDKGRSKERETSKEKERETEKEKEKENVKPRHSTDKPSSSTPSPKLGIGLFLLTKNKSSDNVAIEDKNKSVHNSEDDVRKESGTEKTKAKLKEKEKEQFQEQEQDKVKPSRFGLSRSSSSDFNRGEVLAETGYARNAEDRGSRVTGAGIGAGTESDQNKHADGRSETAAGPDLKLHVESDHSSSCDPVLETTGSFSTFKNEYAVASAVSQASSPNADSSTSSPDGTKKISVPFTQNKDSSAAKSTVESPETKPEAPADSATDANDLVKKSLRETLERNERPQKPNQPLEMKDSAFGFPLPPVSQSTLVMLDHRLPVHIERAIYRLSHLKLADPKRQLRQQVLLSNFMYSYLNLVNHTLWIQSKEQETDQQDETDAANGEKATVSGTSISVS